MNSIGRLERRYFDHERRWAAFFRELFLVSAVHSAQRVLSIAARGSSALPIALLLERYYCADDEGLLSIRTTINPGQGRLLWIAGQLPAE